MIELRPEAGSPVSLIADVQAIAERYPGEHDILILVERPLWAETRRAIEREQIGPYAELRLGPRWKCSAAPAVLSMLRCHGGVRVVAG